MRGGDQTKLRELISHTALLELIPDAFVGIQASGDIILANAQTEALFGYSRDELIGKPVEMLLSERFATAYREQRAGYLADPGAHPMGLDVELAGRRSDGSEFPAEVSLSSLELDNGETLAAAAIRDISERVAVVREKERLEVEAERERQTNQLNHSRRLESLGELAGGIAHDFNNLLAVIVNYADLVAEDLQEEQLSQTDEKRAAMLADVGQITLAAERAAHLTHQLLAFARREVIQPEVIDVNSVVADVEQLLRRTLGEHIDLRSELAESLFPVLVDPGQLEQILVNLAVNARDAMPKGGTLTIDTANIDLNEQYRSRAHLTPGPYVRLRVSDSGKGMAPEVVERAFDPFFTTKAAGQGTGLGLATVYGIVEQAGGRAQIYSELGVGTTFSALLPATDVPLTEPPPEPQAGEHRGDATILLVEDENALREVAARILVGAGYRVIAAADGADALALAAERDGPIDLLLTDVIMPRIHGPQLAQEIRRLRPELKVIFMSGFAQPILDTSGHLEAGTVLIEKPFSAPDMLAKVRQMLSDG